MIDRNEIAERQQQKVIRDALIGIKCEPTRPPYITPSEASLWHAYCLGFEAGVKEALRQVRVRVYGTTT